MTLWKIDLKNDIIDREGVFFVFHDLLRNFSHGITTRFLCLRNGVHTVLLVLFDNAAHAECLKSFSFSFPPSFRTTWNARGAWATPGRGGSESRRLVSAAWAFVCVWRCPFSGRRARARHASNGKQAKRAAIDCAGQRKQLLRFQQASNSDPTLLNATPTFFSTRTFETASFRKRSLLR